MPYKYLEGFTSADICFEASGKNLEELFESAGLATTNTMVKNLKKISSKEKAKISIEADTIENLLFKFLEEIIFLKDARRLLLSKFKIKIDKGKAHSLACEASGEKINIKKHEMIVDVKAVTWHKFEVRNEGKVWRARVILDI